MQTRRLTVFVEGDDDRVIVGHLLHAADLADGVEIVVCGGKRNVAVRIASLRNSPTRSYAALVDSDEMSVADSVSEARKQLKNPAIAVFCAVPTIEAWLFADDAAALDAARNEHAKQQIHRMPLPESIPYPKQLAAHVFLREPIERPFLFLRSVNIERATARSPSLRAFLIGIAEILNRQSTVASNALETSVGRDTFSTLLRELPGESVVWKTSAGTSIEAAELAKHVTEGTDIGKQYVSEVLRIARDLVARKARQ